MLNNTALDIALSWVLAFVLIAAWLFFRARDVKAYRRQRARATKARARILKIDHSYRSEQTGDILVELTLEIIPPKGDPYQLSDIEWYISPASAPKVQEGVEIAIRIDAKDRRVIFPSERWARLG